MKKPSRKKATKKANKKKALDEAFLFEIPESLKVELGGTVLMRNNFQADAQEFFFQNRKCGKKLVEKEKVVFTKRSAQMCGVLSNNTADVTYETTLAELEAFLKYVKANYKQIQKLEKKRVKQGHRKCMPHFIHFNPELSFFIKE